MTFIKDNIRKTLIAKGRELVKLKGADYLTARKLAEASEYSVGTIYNQFGTMDNFVLEQNKQTLDELLRFMLKTPKGESSYQMLNRYFDAFVNFVSANRNLWFLLYNFHLHAEYVKLPKLYLRKLVMVTKVWEGAFDDVYGNLKVKERQLARQVLWLTLFSLSSFLTTNALDNFSRINKKSLCKLLLNTYLAGLTVLRA